MITKEQIQKYLRDFKIRDVQFDLNGVCNAGCWFCPVKYETMPSRQNMPIVDVEKILDKIVSSKNSGGIVSRDFCHIYTAHYNEILLYPYFAEFLSLLENRGLFTMILTNGTTLTPKIADILKKYERVISGINFNIPAIEKEEWKKQTNIHSDTMYNRLLENISYIMTIFPERVANKNISVGMNGINQNSFLDSGGWIERGTNLTIENHTLNSQHKLFKQMYPQLHIYVNPSVVDRDNLLEKNDIISLRAGSERYNKKNYVVGCRNGSQSFKTGELTGRPFGWLHINTFGDLFLCCQDFHLKSTFGNILASSLEDIWFSDAHVNLIYESFNGPCARCNFSQWE